MHLNKKWRVNWKSLNEFLVNGDNFLNFPKNPESMVKKTIIPHECMYPHANKAVVATHINMNQDARSAVLAKKGYLYIFCNKEVQIWPLL